MPGFAPIYKPPTSGKPNRFQDAHDRQPKPVVKKKKKSAVSSFLGAVADAGVKVKDYIGDIDLVYISPGARVRKFKVKDEVRAVGEASGVNSVRRIRKGEGGAGDWLAVGTMAFPPARLATRAGMLAAKAPAFGAIPPHMVKNLTKAGYSKVDKAEPIEKTFERIRGGGYAGVHVLDSPRLGYTGDRGFGGRIPWVVDEKTGEVFVGNIGDSHSDVIAKRLGEINIPKIRSQLENKYRPGYFYQGKPNEPAFLETEWGTFSGGQPVRNTKPTERLFEMMFGESHGSKYMPENFHNPQVRGEPPLSIYGNSDSVFLENMLSQFNRKEVARLKATRMKHGYGRGRGIDYDAFAQTEKMRKRGDKLGVHMGDLGRIREKYAPPAAGGSPKFDPDYVFHGSNSRIGEGMQIWIRNAGPERELVTIVRKGDLPQGHDGWPGPGALVKDHTGKEKWIAFHPEDGSLIQNNKPISRGGFAPQWPKKLTTEQKAAAGTALYMQYQRDKQRKKRSR